MFTQAQIESYRKGQDFYIAEGEEVTPPRTFNINDYPDFPGSGDEFGEGQLLVLGVQNKEFAECECENSHIIYMPIREDGLIGGPITSNSVGEAMALHPDVDPLMVMIGAIDLSEVDHDGIAPTWDEMREVTPDEWPAESVEPKTDMSNFEF